MAKETSLMAKETRSLFGFTAILGRLLPPSTKRLILFASLTARISKDKVKFDSSTLHKLNEIMVLSNRDDALALPIHLSKVIWKGDDGDVMMYPTAHDEKMAEDEIVDKIMKRIPEWLKYANTKSLREDLVRLLRHQELICT